MLGRRGFTLVELLVVLVIVGIAASVVAPAFRSPGSGQDASELLSLFRTARSVAAERGVVVTVRLELASGAYEILGQPVLEDAPVRLKLGALSLEEGSRLQGGSGGYVEARFTPLGTARADRVLVTSVKDTYEVVIDPWTATASKRRL